jgi:hypothetical protein
MLGVPRVRRSQQIEERVNHEVGLAEDRTQNRAFEIARVHRDADEKLGAVRGWWK